MEKSPSWEAKSFSSSQEILHSVKPEVSLPHHNSPSPVPILSQINTVHVSSFHFLKIQFNIILPSMLRFSKYSLSLRSPISTLYAPFLSPICPTCHSHVYYRCSLILSSHLCLGFTSNLFPSGLPTSTLYAPFLSPYVPHATPKSIIWHLNRHIHVWLYIYCSLKLLF